MLHSAVARQIFYGGSAGGGKSVALRWDAIAYCLRNPGLQAYLFRRTLPELLDNHIKWLKREVPREIAEWHEAQKTLHFKNGSAIVCCYCDRDDDVWRYLGAEMHWVGLDEASRMTENQINLLRTRCRLGSFKPAPAFALSLPRFLMASNPGGPAHSFLKRTFIDGVKPGTYFNDLSMRDPTKPDDPGWLSLFIPAKMSDNKYIDANYAASFSGLPPELARAYRDGDWDAVVGQALHSLSRERHMLRPFQPPRHWTRFMSIDWGLARPFAVAWFTVSEGATLKGHFGKADKPLPAGAIIMYDEIYGWNGRANEGARIESPAVARSILEREGKRGDTMDYRIADGEMWSRHDGPSVIERMQQISPVLSFRPAKKDRRHNYAEFLARLAGNPSLGEDGATGELPMFYATSNCTHFWRTVPPLTLDETDPEKGPDTTLEDHMYDAVAYGLRSRPYIRTIEDRWQDANAEDIRALKPVDFYATA